LNNKYTFNLDHENYLLDEVDPEAVRNRENSLQEIDHLKKSNIEFFKKHPFDQFESDLKEKLLKKTPFHRSRSQRSRFNIFKFVLVPSLSAVAIISFFLVINFTDTMDHPKVDQKQIADIDKSIRVKGKNSYLQIYRKNNNANERLKDLSRVQAGDVIQLCYFSSNKFGAIFSVDGNGVVTVHYPDNKTVSALLKQNELTPLNFSYKLDNAPFEIFYLVTSNREFNINDIIKSAKSNFGNKEKINDRPLNLPDGFNQYQILLSQ
jgi:hypothetical protein